jgi:WD40 repeat protein
MSEQFDVFLCHNSKEKAEVKKIREQLKERGIYAWLDKDDFEPFLPFQEQLERIIPQIKVAAIFVGPSGVGLWENIEMQVFLDEFANRRIRMGLVILPNCPVHVIESVSRFIKIFHWVDFRCLDPDPMEQLVWGITGNKPSEIVANKQASNSEIERSVITVSHSSKSVFRGKSTDISNFIGRNADIEELERLIVQERYKMIAIVGMGGLGKSSLAEKFTKADNIKNEFKDRIWWISLLDAPSFEATLSILIKRVSRQTKDYSEPVNSAINELLQLLRENRCLIVLDNVETIIEKECDETKYLAGYEKYGELFNKFGKDSHNSCVLLTSRETSKEIIDLDKDKTCLVKIKQLEGLNVKDGKAILDRFSCRAADEKEWKEIINLYEGNPLALELVAAHIAESHNYNISDFLKNGDKSTRDIQELIGWHFDRLTSIQQMILHWLAINREPIEVSELYDDIILSAEDSNQVGFTVKLSSLNLRINFFPSLKRRIPIIYEDRGNNIHFFGLQPVLIEFMTEKLIQEIHDEINNESPNFLGKYTLSKSSAKDSLRLIHNRLILTKIIQKFDENLIKKLERIIPKLKDDSFLQSSYAAGNILNLLCQVQREQNIKSKQNNPIILRNYDFSGLHVLQAYLRGVNLHKVNFSGCEFFNSFFTQAFDRVKSLAFSPKDSEDRVYLLTGHPDQKARLWNVENGYFIGVCEGHTDWIRAVDFSPTGKVFATGSDDQTIKLWKIEESNPLRSTRVICVGQPLTGHTKWIWAIAFSPDGKLLASASADCLIKLWDISDVSNPKFKKDLKGHDGEVLSVSFSKNGSLLASGSSDGKVKIWDVKSGKCKKTLKVGSPIESVSFNKDGKYLASGSKDGRVRVWNIIENYNELKPFEGHNKQVKSLCFSPSSESLLASAGGDCEIKLWDLQKWECVNIFAEKHTDIIESIRFSHDGLMLASGGDDQEVRLWDVQSCQCLRTLKGFTNWVWSLAFSPDNSNILASANGDWTVRLWNINDERCILHRTEHTSGVMSVSYRKDGKILASCSDDNKINIWSIRQNRNGYMENLQYLDESSQGHTDKIKSICFSPDGLKLASVGYDASIIISDIEFGDNPRLGDWTKLGCHASQVWCVVFSPDGNLLATCSSHGDIKLWNMTTRQLLATIDHHSISDMHQPDNEIWSIAFSPDGNYLASGSEDNTIKIWDIKDPTSPSCFRTLRGHERWIWSVAFSPDGNLLASGSGDKKVKLWDVTTGECLQTFDDHKDCVWTVAFSHDSQRLASGSSDETIKVWDISNPKNAILQANLRADRPYEGMDITDVEFTTKPIAISLISLGAVDRNNIP